MNGGGTTNQKQKQKFSRKGLYSFTKDSPLYSLSDSSSYKLQTTVRVKKSLRNTVPRVSHRVEG